jgi:hypothetical protein
MGERIAVVDESPSALTTETLVIPPDLLYIDVLQKSPEFCPAGNSATNTSNTSVE